MSISIQNTSIIDINSILNSLVSFQSNAWSPLNRELTVGETLNEIKDGKYRTQILRLRSLLKDGNLEAYNNHKKNLPAITFGGTFKETRKKSSLKRYNSIIVLDVDKLDEKELLRVKKCFLEDNVVFSFWESPSQKGIKGLVYLQYSFELDENNIDNLHKAAFKKLSDHFTQNYNIKLDNSGSDITRLCFYSFDPTLVIKKLNGFQINENDIILPVDDVDKKETGIIQHISSRDALFNPNGRNEPSDRYTMKAIIRYLHKKTLSITYNYEEWLKVGLAISNSFTFDVGEKYFLKLSSIDKEKFNENNCKNFLINCYENRSGALKFNTIVYLANKKGYKTKKQREKGSEAASSQISSSKTVLHLPEDLNK